MKDLKWAIKEIEGLMTEESQSYPHDKMIEQEIVLGILNQLDVETLSPEFIEDHKEKWQDLSITGYSVPVDDLQNLLVPKDNTQEQWRELTEFLVNERVFGHEDRDYLVVEKPVIPQFVADWLEEMKQEERPLYSVMSTLMNKTNHKWSVWKNANKNFSEIVAQVWLAYPDIEIEEEPKYYAKIKGWENVTTGSERFNWVYFKEKDTVGVSKAIENKYQAVSFTKDEWENLGINDDNADFVEVEEVEE